nr:hypothetical protein [Tanacetum cinerariifolium]
SPTTESPGYVAESDLEEDPEYEDDEEQDGLVDYPMGEGDDGGDDDNDSSRDDAADEDEDMEEEEEEEEEHIASVDSTVVIPIVELVSSPEGTKPVLPPPSIDITTTRARISVRLQASVSLPSMVDVERLLALPALPLSPLTSLSPPFAGERLARLTDSSIHPSPLLLPSSGDEILESERPPRKRSCLFAIGSRYKAGESSTTRPTGGQGTYYGFVSTVDFEARIGDQGCRDFHALLEDAQDGRSRISQRVDKNSHKVDLLMGDRMTLEETVWTVEEEAYAARVVWNHSIRLSQATYQELQTHRDHVDMRQEMSDMHISARAVEDRETARTELQTHRDHVYAHETHIQTHQTQLQLQSPADETLRVVRDMRQEMSDMQKELISQREQQIMVRTRRGQTPPPTNPNNMTPKVIQTMIDQALLRNFGGGDGSHSSHAEKPRNMHTVRPCYYADFMKCQPLNFKGTEGAFGLTHWIEKMESVFNIGGCAVDNQVKFATRTLLDATLTWWNIQIRTLGPDAYTMTWSVLKKKMTDKYCPLGEVKKLEIELWNLKVRHNNIPAYTNRFQELALICTKFVSNETEKVDKYISGLPENIYGNVKSSKPKTLDVTIELANELIDQKLRTYVERKSDSKRKADDISRNNQQPFKKQNVAKAYNLGSAMKKTYEGNAPKCTRDNDIPTYTNLFQELALICTKFIFNETEKVDKYISGLPDNIYGNVKSTSDTNATNNRGGNRPNPRGNGCFEYRDPGHFKRDCPKLKNKNRGNENAQGWVYVVGNAERNGNAAGNPDSNVVT